MQNTPAPARLPATPDNASAPDSAQNAGSLAFDMPARFIDWSKASAMRALNLRQPVASSAVCASACARSAAVRLPMPAAAPPVARAGCEICAMRLSMKRAVLARSLRCAPRCATISAPAAHSSASAAAMSAALYIEASAAEAATRRAESTARSAAGAATQRLPEPRELGRMRMNAERRPVVRLFAFGRGQRFEAIEFLRRDD